MTSYDIITTVATSSCDQYSRTTPTSHHKTGSVSGHTHSTSSTLHRCTPHTFYALTHPHTVGPGYAPPPPFPVMRGGSADEGFLMSPSDAPHMLSPQDPLSMVFPVPPTPHTHEHPIKGGESNKTEKKQLPKLPKTKTDNSVSAHSLFTLTFYTLHCR